MKTPEEQYQEVEQLENQLEDLEDRIEKQKEALVQSLAEEQGLSLGDKVKTSNGEIVVIHRFKLSYSNNYSIGMRYKKKISEEEYNELTKRKFSLGAYCYLTTAKGEVSKRENPMNHERVLEDCKKIE